MSDASAAESERRTHEQGFTAGHNPWVIALTVTMATFMEVLDTSIANVSLPHIAGSLSSSFDEATWVLTSYLVSNAVILPISGWLATRAKQKKVEPSGIIEYCLVITDGVRNALCTAHFAHDPDPSGKRSPVAE